VGWRTNRQWYARKYAISQARISGTAVATHHGVTQPRRVLPGSTVLITRRTLRRTHLLRPDRELNQLYLYILAVVANRYAIRVHAVVLMSTHEHLIVTDTRGCLPNFLRELHRLVALAVKALRKWEGAVWDHERPSVVELRTPEAIVEKLAYIMANPVAAGLVRAAKDWPGIQTLPEELGEKTFEIARPSFYLDQNNPLWPEHATLELAMPTISGLSASQIQEAVTHELAEHEQAARASAQHAGLDFLGAKRIHKASPYDRARSWEPLRGRNPRFAVGTRQRQAFFDAVAELRAFYRSYREALDRWRSGVRTACFPSGTWVMRVVHAAATG
jgi:putative transposase